MATGRAVISVVVACRDAAPWVEAAIASALDQPEVAEVIVVEDGSTDASPDLVAAMATRDRRVRLLRGDGTGPAAARNRGIAAARGTWIAILDADDLFEPGRCAALLAAAGDADLIADDLLLFGDGDAARPLIGAPDGPPQAVTAARLLAGGPFGRAPNLGYLKPMIRRAALKRTGIRYDETLRIGEDDDLVLRLLGAGCRYRLLPRPLYRYRRHAGSLSHRLTVADLNAMAAALRGAATAFDRDDLAIAGALRRRMASIARARRFGAAVVALKARRPLAAVRALAWDTGALALFRLPIAARLRRRAAAAPPAAPPVPIAAVTVCVCTYRRASIADTLASLARQRGARSLRVVVADNDGDPRARARIEAAAAGLALRYVHAPARNVSVARNAALAAVETRWAAFLDDDGVARDDWLIRLTEGATGYAAVIGHTKAIYPPGAPAWLNRADFHSNRLRRGAQDGHTANALIDMTFVRAHDIRFRPDLGVEGGEDTLFFRGIAAAGGRIGHAPDAVVDEPVAPDRATMRWVLARRFRSGRTHALALRAYDRGGYRRLPITAAAKTLIFAAAAMVCGPGTVASRSALARAALHAGAWWTAIRSATVAQTGGAAGAAAPDERRR